MRFFICVIIWVVLVGGMGVYTSHRDAGLPNGPSPVKIVQEEPEGNYTLEITPTFSLAKDPFALDTGEASPLLTLIINGKNLDLQREEMQRGQPIIINSLKGLRKGTNEIFVKASPSSMESSMDNAIRVRLIHGVVPLVDNTVWGGRGALVAGTIGFDLDDKERDRHDH